MFGFVSEWEIGVSRREKLNVELGLTQKQLYHLALMSLQVVIRFRIDPEFAVLISTLRVD